VTRQNRDRQNLERQNWDKLTLVVDNVGSCVKSPQILHVLAHIILEDSPRNFGFALKFSVTKFHGDRRSCETSIKVNIINQSIKQTHKETIFTWPAYVAVLLVHRRQSVDVQQVVRKRLPEQMCLEEATKCGQ